jgi:putative PepSY-like beta-lactamase-inhibitor
MKIQQRLKGSFYALSALVIAITSCSKEVDNGSAEFNTSDAIAVLASESASVSSTLRTAADSVYIMQSCARGEKREIVAEADLPAGITDYLTANYSGYSFNKAFAIKSSDLATTGYVVVIYYNDKPVGLQFDVNGTFVKVLEQREKGDFHGRGWHLGGRFEEREGKHRDTVALSALPSAVTSYISTNYAGDTLVKAFKNRDSSLVVITKNNGLYASVFNSGNIFQSRIQLPAKGGKHQDVAQSALPATALTYLETTYPNYVFNKAFSITIGGSLKGYIVLLDANSTKYAISFDTSGNFLQAKTIY